MARRTPDPHDRLAAILARGGPEDDEEAGTGSGRGPGEGPVILDADLEEPYVPDPQERAGRDARPPPRVISLPGALREVRTRPAAGAVAGFFAVLLLAAAVFGVRAWWARADAALEPFPAAGDVPPTSTDAAGIASSAAPEAPSAPAPAPSGPASHGPAAHGPAAHGPAASGPAASGPGSPAVAGGEVYVHVVGRVARPGVVRIPAGSRVVDAVERSGGVARGGDLSTVNLARPVTDGEQIIVLAKGETPPPVAAGPAGVAPPPGGGPPPAGGAGAATPSGGSVNLNTADAAALESLPGVGPVLAQRILDWRAAHGRFSSVDELAEVSGVGPKTLARLAPLLTL